MTETENRKEKETYDKQEMVNPIQTTTLDILQSKKSEPKHWLSFQDIVDGFENKAVLLDYWNTPDEFTIDLGQALKILETKAKIEKKIVGKETYFSVI